MKLKFIRIKCPRQQLCSRTPKLLPAVVSFRKMDRPSALLSITKFQNPLIFQLRNQVKLLLYHLNTSRSEIIFTLVCLENHLSHIIQTHSEADFHNQLLLCHTKTHLRSLSVIDQLTTRDNSFQPIWTPMLSQNHSRQETLVSSLIRLLDLNICKNFEIWYDISRKYLTLLVDNH